TLWLAVFAVLTLASLTALISGSAALRDAMDTMARDTRSAALANELEAAVLMHQRLSNLHVVTGETELDAARNVLVGEIGGMSERAREPVGAEEEHRLLEGIADKVAAYL